VRKKRKRGRLIKISILSGMRTSNGRRWKTLSPCGVHIYGKPEEPPPPLSLLFFQASPIDTLEAATFLRIHGKRVPIEAAVEVAAAVAAA